ADAASGWATGTLHVERRTPLLLLDGVPDVRCERGQRLEDRVPDLLLPVVPRSAVQPIRRVLRVDGERDFAGRCETRVRHGVQDAIQERLPGRFTPFRVVPCALQVIDGRTDVDVASVVRV